METPTTPLLFCAILSSLILSPVSATTISFSDLNLDTSTQIAIYNPALNESLVGIYNATDTVTLPDGGDYIFVLRPGPQHWFENPLNSLELLKTGMPTFITYLLWFIALAGGLFIVLKVLR